MRAYFRRRIWDSKWHLDECAELSFEDDPLRNQCHLSFQLGYGPYHTISDVKVPIVPIIMEVFVIGHKSVRKIDSKVLNIAFIHVLSILA